MQQKLKLLQDELDAVKLQLAQLDVNPPNAAVPMLLATSGTQKKKLKQVIDVNQAAMQQDSPYLHENLFPALGLVLFILTLWLGLRYYIKTKSRIGTNLQQNSAPKICVSP